MIYVELSLWCYSWRYWLYPVSQQEDTIGT